MHVPESPLHRDLKHLYAARCGGELEKRVEGFRVDVISGDTIYEIQVKNLYKIKRKIQILASAGYNAVIVHPLQGILDVELPLRSRRRIRRDQNPLRAFIELPYVATTIAMERVALEIPLLHEVRTQKQWRRNRVRNTRLVEVMELWRVDEPGDLVSLLPARLPPQFTTREIASSCQVGYDLACKIAYVLNRSGAAEKVGRRGRFHLYSLKQATPEIGKTE